MLRVTEGRKRISAVSRHHASWAGASQPLANEPPDRFLTTPLAAVEAAQRVDGALRRA